MKIYFFENGNSMVADFAFENDVPEHVASFDLGDRSTFSLRYSLVDKKLVDNYPNKTDEEVAQILNDLENAKAKELELRLASNTP